MIRPSGAGTVTNLATSLSIVKFQGKKRKKARSSLAENVTSPGHSKYRVQRRRNIGSLLVPLMPDLPPIQRIPDSFYSQTQTERSQTHKSKRFECPTKGVAPRW